MCVTSVRRLHKRVPTTLSKVRIEYDRENNILRARRGQTTVLNINALSSYMEAEDWSVTTGNVNAGYQMLVNNIKKEVDLISVRFPQREQERFEKIQKAW